MLINVRSDKKKIAALRSHSTAPRHVLTARSVMGPKSGYVINLMVLMGPEMEGLTLSSFLQTPQVFPILQTKQEVPFNSPKRGLHGLGKEEQVHDPCVFGPQFYQVPTVTNPPCGVCSTQTTKKTTKTGNHGESKTETAPTTLNREG